MIRTPESWVLVRPTSHVAHLAPADGDARCGVKRPRAGWGQVADGLGEIAPWQQNPCERCEVRVFGREGIG